MGTKILRGVDAGIPEGRVSAIVGPSGAGRSTLLRAINRLVEPSAGEMFLDGKPAGDLDPLDLRSRVGMVVGNSMNAANLAITGVGDDVVALAPGATSRQAVSPVLKTARPGPPTDSTKTTGIVFLPWRPHGLQVVLYVLLGSVSIAAICATSRTAGGPGTDLRTAR